MHRNGKQRSARRRTVALGLALLLFAPAVSRAQDLQLAGFGGWRFGGSGRSPVSYQETDIDGSTSFGGSASVRLWGTNALELTFSRSEGDARRTFDDTPLRSSVSYILLGLVHEFPTRGLRPFAGLAFGAARVNETPGGAKTVTAMGAMVGFRVFPTRHVGLRGDARLLFVSDDTAQRQRSRDLYGGASGFTLSGQLTIQAGLTLGLVLAF